jgi:methionyl-tRNA formyltransferase
MKEAALAHSTLVFQPHNVNEAHFVEELRSLRADLFVVAAYGQLLSAEVLQSAARGAINVHASLLPKYRGAAPIQHAILNGETETGITIFQIEPKLDAGPMLGVESTAIGPKETSGDLERRLAKIAAPLLLDVVARLEANSLRPVSQDAAQATKAPRLRKASGAIDWSRSAEEICRQVRAMQPWPTAFTYLHQSGKTPVRLILLDVEAGPPEDGREAGTIFTTHENRVIVQADGGSVEIKQLRPEGKRAMDAADFLRGHSIGPNDRLSGDAHS